MNNDNLYLQVLWKDIRTVPFLILLAYSIISIVSDAWIVTDGTLFHFQNYFIGHLNNSWDFTRYASVITTDLLNLAYIRLGGSNFVISNYLFRIGHAYHIWFPFFLLVYLKYKEPVLRRWAELSLNFYLLSLSLFLSMSFLQYVTEMKASHTMTWMMLIAFRSQSESYGNRKFKHLFLLSVSLFALFTYPLAGICSLLMLFAQSLPLKDLPNDNRENWKIFNTLMFILSVVLVFAYSKMSKTDPDVMGNFARVNSNGTVIFMFVSSIILIAGKPLFRSYYIFFTSLLSIVYVVGAIAKIWHSNPGRFVGILFVIAIQAFYIFIAPYMKENFLPELRRKSYSLGVLVVVVISFQAYRLHLMNNNILEVMDSQKKDLTYSEARALMTAPYSWWLDEWCIESYTMGLQLIRGRKNIGYIVRKDPPSPSDPSDRILKHPDFPKRLAQGNIIFKSYDSYISSETISPPPSGITIQN